MEKGKMEWPGDAGEKPKNWDDWSDEAREYFLELWHDADPEERTNFLEELDEMNPEEQDNYILLAKSVNCSWKAPTPEYEDPPIVGCGLLMMLALGVLVLYFIMR